MKKCMTQMILDIIFIFALFLFIHQSIITNKIRREQRKIEKLEAVIEELQITLDSANVILVKQ
ncbi:MAG: hypothetical protein ACFE95_02740 [Candidatus Hodarchaeota archaeon]